MRIPLVLLATLRVLPTMAADLEPVTVAVVDRDSGEPIAAFTCTATYEAPGRKGPPGGEAWRPVASPAGTFEVQTPPACLLRVRAKAPDYIDDNRSLVEFVIRSGVRPRRAVLRLRRGITVRGTVRDSRTNDPIAGATVAPRTGSMLSSRPDEDKRVRTGVDGRYELRGVDPALGITASHPDYRHEAGDRDDAPTGSRHDISLERGATIAARVVDRDGSPLEGVTADDRTRRKAESGKDGRLVLQNPDTLDGLSFHKDGYIPRMLESGEIHRSVSSPEGLVVVMEPTIALPGRVVDPDGRPVAAFTVVAWPSRFHSLWDFVQRDVRDRNGLFRVGMPAEGKTWVGVAADGFATWEAWVELKRGGEPLEVRLSPGATVSARVGVPEALRNRVRAKLVPRRDGRRDLKEGFFEPETEKFLTQTATPSADGRLHFEHVRPDRYRLTIEGRGVPATALALDVPAAGLDMGTVGIDVPAATGRIEGRVWRPKSAGGGVWPFAKGYVGGFRFKGLGDDDASIEFLADENGRFEADRVPAGLITVGFPYQAGCVIDAYTWSALVVEGQTTVVRAFEPGGRRELTLAFTIGDASKAQYESGTGLGASRKVDNVTVQPRWYPELEGKGVMPYAPRFAVELAPVSAGPLAFAPPECEWFDAKKVVLPDVAPGTYRLRIRDWLGSASCVSDPLFDHEVVVPPGGGGEVRVALGGGCIAGKVPAPGENLERPVQVTAVAKDGRNPSRQARCDDDGNFCVRYLSPGTYSLFIHDPRSGSCRVDDVVVGGAVVDIGEHTLAAGATVRGEIRFVRPSRVPDEVVATGPSDIKVRRAIPTDSSLDRFEVCGLWPGHWTVSARSGGKVLATGELDVEGSGTFPLTLTASGGLEP